MDSITVIAVASIITAGFTTSVGCIAPALGEGRSVATALTALAQQPDASATITRTLFVGLAMIESTAIYSFVVSMIIIFANPFWNHFITQAAGKEAMLIDWFTVGSQLLNFLILVWLMKRFLYKPILQAIDAREKKIAAELADSDAKKSEAKKERDTFHHKNEAFDKERAALLEHATHEAQAERKRLLVEAQGAADALRDKRREAMDRERQTLHDELIDNTRKEVFAIARKTLTELAGDSLEARMADAFTQRVRGLDDNNKQKLRAPLTNSPEPAIVRSAFDLSAEQHGAIQQAINETFSADVRLRFETAPALIGGIELSVGGQKIAWSIDAYLKTLEASIDALLKTQAKPESKAKPSSDAKPEGEVKLITKIEPDVTAPPKSDAKPVAPAEAK